jgi:pimeloyl-ACP methyl ester carboxylesterase
VPKVSALSDSRQWNPLWCQASDGTRVAAYDFGGEGPDLLLAHATGFCAAVLVPMVDRLRHRYHCWGLDFRAHGRSARPDNGDFAWSGFARDVLAVVDGCGLTELSGFGHSCGGASLLLAEQARPGTFRSLYCYEPVVFRETDDSMNPEAFQDNPLSNGARRRRETFPSTEDAFLNFSSKPPFGTFDPDALRNYVESGFEVIPDPEGGDGRTIRLRCRRQDEAEVYAHGGSHGAFGHLPEVVCPVALACGETTDSFDVRYLNADAKQLRRASVEVLPGMGHFGPMERPDVVTESVLNALSTVGDTSSS